MNRKLTAYVTVNRDKRKDARKRYLRKSIEARLICIVSMQS